MKGNFRMRKTVFRWAAAATGLVGVLATTLLVTSSGSASAATPGNLTVCTGSDFFLRVEIPGRGMGIAPTMIPGQEHCVPTYLGGDSNEQVDVYGNDRYLGSFNYNGNQGADVHPLPGPSFYVS